MQLAMKLTILALIGASASVYAHDLRGVAALPAASKETAAGFFPQEMDEADEDRNNRNNRNDYDRNNRNGNNRNRNGNGKMNSAQKRQMQRDERRSRQNPNRSQSEERRERERKTSQASRRGSRCNDPSEPGCGNRRFDRNRDSARESRCQRYGEGCDYGRTWDDPNDRRRNANRDCAERCLDRGARNCDRKCGELANVEDVETMTKFFENVDAMAIADFLFDVYDDEDFYEDEESEDKDDPTRDVKHTTSADYN